MTDQKIDLAAIKARAEKAVEGPYVNPATAWESVKNDIPDLLREVEDLRRAVGVADSHLHNLNQTPASLLGSAIALEQRNAVRKILAKALRGE